MPTLGACEGLAAATALGPFPGGFGSRLVDTCLKLAFRMCRQPMIWKQWSERFRLRGIALRQPLEHIPGHWLRGERSDEPNASLGPTHVILSSQTSHFGWFQDNEGVRGDKGQGKPVYTMVGIGMIRGPGQWCEQHSPKKSHSPALTIHNHSLLKGHQHKNQALSRSEWGHGPKTAR